MAKNIEKDAVQEPLVEFEEWFAARESRIPAQHRMEILKADFRAQRIPLKATMAQWDAALIHYGVELI